MADGVGVPEGAPPILDKINCHVARILKLADIGTKQQIVEELTEEISVEIITESRELLFDDAVNLYKQSVCNGASPIPCENYLKLKARRGDAMSGNCDDIYELYGYILGAKETFPRTVLSQSGKNRLTSITNSHNEETLISDNLSQDTQKQVGVDIIKLQAKFAEVIATVAQYEKTVNTLNKRIQDIEQNYKQEISQLKAQCESSGNEIIRMSSLLSALGACENNDIATTNKSRQPFGINDPLTTISRLANKHSVLGSNESSRSASTNKSSNPLGAGDKQMTLNRFVNKHNGLPKQIETTAEIHVPRIEQARQMSYSPIDKQSTDVDLTGDIIPVEPSQNPLGDIEEVTLGHLETNENDTFAGVLQKHGPWMIKNANKSSSKQKEIKSDNNKTSKNAKSNIQNSQVNNNNDTTHTRIKYTLEGIKIEKTRDLYLSNIKFPRCATHRQIIEEVTGHAEARNVRIAYVKVFRNRYNQDTVGCKISVPITHVNKIMLSGFWPEYVECRNWEPRSRKPFRRRFAYRDYQNMYSQENRTDDEDVYGYNNNYRDYDYD